MPPAQLKLFSIFFKGKLENVRKWIEKKSVDLHWTTVEDEGVLISLFFCFDEDFRWESRSSASGKTPLTQPDTSTTLDSCSSTCSSRCLSRSKGEAARCKARSQHAAWLQACAWQQLTTASSCRLKDSTGASCTCVVLGSIVIWWKSYCYFRR